MKKPNIPQNSAFYTRAGMDSNVTVAYSNGFWTCYCTGVNGVQYDTIPNIMEHLIFHKEIGDAVPEGVFHRLVVEWYGG